MPPMALLLSVLCRCGVAGTSCLRRNLSTVRPARIRVTNMAIISIGSRPTHFGARRTRTHQLVLFLMLTNLGVRLLQILILVCGHLASDWEAARFPLCSQGR